MIEREYLKATAEMRKKLRKVFEKGARTINDALSYREKHNPTLARKIRTAAREMGAEDMVVLPLCETIYDDGEAVIRQEFENGAMLVISKKTGDGELLFDGTSVAQYKDIKLRELRGIQFVAADLTKKKLRDTYHIY